MADRSGGLTDSQRRLRERNARIASADRERLDDAHAAEFADELLRAEQIAAEQNPGVPAPDWEHPVIDTPLHPTPRNVRRATTTSQLRKSKNGAAQTNKATVHQQGLDTETPPAADRGCLEGNPPPSGLATPNETEMKRIDMHSVTADGDNNLWDATPQLAHIRDAAHSRFMSPGAVLGIVLGYRLAEVPPNILIPPTIGSAQGLNFFISTYGAPSFGKTSAEEVGRDLLGTNGVAWCPVAGSGEKLAGTFAKHNGKEPGGIEFTRRSAVMFYDEVTALAGMANRSGSTLNSWLIAAWPGQALGAAVQDRDRSTPLPAHTYRLCLIVGVQPGNAHHILDHHESGLPQRFLWTPTTDPSIADLPVTDDDWLPITPIPGLIDIPRPELAGDPKRLDPQRFVDVCSEARLAIRTVGRDKHNPAIHSPGNGHELLLRCKVACGLSLLRPGNDMPVVDDESWELAGRVLTELHAPVLAEATAAVRDRAVTHARAQGALDDIRADAADRNAEDRVTKNIRDKLKAAGDQGMSRSTLRGKIASRSRDIFDEVIEQMVSTGEVVSEPTAGGHRYYTANVNGP